MNHNQTGFDPEHEVSIAFVVQGMRDNSIHLIDVREQDEWDAGRIAGSTFMPMSDFTRRLSEIDPSMPIVTVCHAGVRSLYVAEALVNTGFPNVRSMAGGMAAWMAAGLPVEI